MKSNFQKQNHSGTFISFLLGCMAFSTAQAATEPVPNRPTSMAVSALPGIKKDNLRAALTAFQRSCVKYIGLGPNKPIAPGYTGTKLAPDYPKLMRVCADAIDLLKAPASDPDVILAMLDRHFEAVEAVATPGASLLTAYFEPTFPISKVKIDGMLDWPLYSRPTNLPAGVAWFSRQAIESGQASDVLDDHVLCFTDRWSAYVLNIQGSGIGVMPDKTPVRLIYAGKNGWPYTSIGRVLVERGEIAQDKISMQEIKKWLESHSSAEQDALYWRNQSYVFYEIDNTPTNDRVGPPGAMSLEVGGLTPYRSAAVDWAHFVPGMPLFIQGKLGNGQELAQLIVAQDRGGAITSKVRVDLFLGGGNEAAETAGKTRDENLKLWTLQFRSSND